MSTNRPYRLGVMLGDGIGPEIVPASVRVVDAALAAAGAEPVEWQGLALGAAAGRAIPGAGSPVPRRFGSGAALVTALVASDARMPFGGPRASGYGRELAAAGIREFVNVRTWWVLDEPAGTAPVSE